MIRPTFLAWGGFLIGYLIMAAHLLVWPNPSRGSVGLSHTFAIRAVMNGTDRPSHSVGSICFQFASDVGKFNTEHRYMFRSFWENIFVSYPPIEIQMFSFILNCFDRANRNFQESTRDIFLWAEDKRSIGSWLTDVGKREMLGKWTAPRKEISVIVSISSRSCSAIRKTWTEFPIVDFLLSRNNHSVFLQRLPHVYESSLDGNQRVAVDIVGFSHRSQLAIQINQTEQTNYSRASRYPVEPSGDSNLSVFVILFLGVATLIVGGFLNSYGIKRGPFYALMTGWFLMVVGIFLILMLLVPFLAQRILPTTSTTVPRAPKPYTWTHSSDRPETPGRSKQ